MSPPPGTLRDVGETPRYDPLRGRSPIRVATNGIELETTDVGDGPAVVLLHGFPETSYSWRHQVPALAAAGLRVIAPDLRGFGGSAKPEPIEAYSLAELVADVIGLLDSLGVDEASVVGHDWGSVVAWETARLHPERVSRLVSLNVPYLGHPAMFPSIEYITENLADRFGYVLFFQEPGVAEAWFAEDLTRRLGEFYRRAAFDPAFLTEQELSIYVESFAVGGMRGPLNLYRNIDANIAATADAVGSTIDVGTLQIMADSDPVLPASLADGMAEFVPELEIIRIEQCGHWTQQERPAAVNDALLGFLA